MIRKWPTQNHVSAWPLATLVIKKDIPNEITVKNFLKEFIPKGLKSTLPVVDRGPHRVSPLLHRFTDVL